MSNIFEEALTIKDKKSFDDFIRQKKNNFEEKIDRTKMAYLMNNMPLYSTDKSKRFTSRKETMNWLREFSLINDYCYIKYDKEMFLSHFEKLGYKDNECINDSRGKTDADFFMRWYIGQFMKMIREYGSVHYCMSGQRCPREDE